MSSLARTPRGVKASANGLELPDGLSFEDWVSVGKQIAERANAFAWAVGDWLFYGEWTYGKTYQEGAESLGLDVGTLYNYRSVAGRFDISRRREDLSFGHHAAVASLDPPAADRLLERASAQGWSMRELRDEARVERDRRQTTPAPAPRANEPERAAALTAAGADLSLVESNAVVHLEPDVGRSRSWAAAAAAAGKSLEAWARDELDRAADAAAVS